MMEWRKLLSPKRARLRSTEPSGPVRSAFQKDWDRVVFSSAFRRLQDKTQVHSLPESDYVRTRLTHSMEVSSVGRSLGAAVGHVVLQRQPGLAEHATAADFGHIVAAACLAHDIGNPPFGHFGEETIRHWFKDPKGGADLLAGLSPAQQADLTGFEGNAQGFRILTRLQNWRDEGGLRLTAATLAAFTKYPRESLLAGAEAETDPGAAKFGIFQDEKPQFADVAAAVGLVRRSNSAAYWCRHPLAFLVEAADDICYRVVDLEDGFKLGRLDFAQVEHLLLALVGKPPARYRDIADAPRRVAYLRAKAIGRLIDDVAAAFLDQEQQILAGTLPTDLLSTTAQRSTLASIATLTAAQVFQTRERFQTELAGIEILTTLLAAFAGAMEERAQAQQSGASLSPRCEVLSKLMPDPIVMDDPYRRLLQVTDFVSGMTDSYALAQFRRLKGLLKT